ncbi:MAG: lipopolysaccharide biosynthesis protein [Planctomycetota bacterium]
MNLQAIKSLTFESDQNRGLLAIMDQLVVSGTNFLVIAMLGRYAGAEHLGRFTLGFSVVVIAVTAIRSLLMTPYAVYAQKESHRRRDGMRGTVLIGCGILCTVATLIGIAVGFMLMRTEASYGQFLVIVSLAIPAMTLRELGRQMSFADLRFARAVCYDAIACTIYLVSIAWLILNDRLSASSAMIALMIATSFAGISWLVVNRTEFDFFSETIREDISRYWSFGRWGAAGQASHVAQSYCVHWVLAIAGGVNATGLFAAVWSVVQLASPFVQGAGNALTPLLAKRLNDEGRDSLRHAILRCTQLALLAAAIYLLAIWLAGPFIMRTVFGSDFQDTEAITIWLGCSVALATLGLAPTKVISVLGFPHVNFSLNFLGLFVTALLAGILGSFYGIEGTAIALMVAAMIGMIAKWGCYRSVMQR